MTKATTAKLTSAQTKALNKLETKSAKIRYLTSLDWTRRQIADKVGVIYQFVRNVQVTQLTGSKK